MGIYKMRKIVSPLLLAGTLSAAAGGAAWATAMDTTISSDGTYVIGTGDEEYQYLDGEYTIDASSGNVTVTMTMEDSSSSTNVNAVSGSTIIGSSGGTRNSSTLVIQGLGASSGTAVAISGGTLTDVDLEISGYYGALGGNVTINNNSITVKDCESFIYNAGTVNITTGTLDVTVDNSTSSVTYGIYWSSGKEVSITADTISFKSDDATGSNSGYGIFASNGSSYTEAPITIKGSSITIDGFGTGIDLQQYAKVSIVHTGTGEDNTLNITNSNYHGYNTGSGIYVQTYSTITIDSDGVINISNNGLDGINVFANSAASSGYSADNRGVTITGQGNTIVNFDNNVEAGIFAYGTYAVLIQNVDQINISNTSGDYNQRIGLYVSGSSSHGIDIDGVNTMVIDMCDAGIYNESSGGNYGVNITNVGALTIQNCIDSGDTGVADVGIYSNAANGVNIAATDSVTFDNNDTGVWTNRADGVTITGYDTENKTSTTYTPQLTFTNNGRAIYVEQYNASNSGTLNFSAENLTAQNNNILAWTNGTGTSITLTADKATITGQIQDGQTTSRYSSNDYTLYAQTGGEITLNVGDLTASRDTGYFAYADTNTASKIEISADTGSIKGAFWTGATDNTSADSSGTINLSLGAGSSGGDISWTITDNSKVTDLTLGDKAALVFDYQKGNDDSSKFLNLYTSSMASGNGSNITMNINGAARDQSDHIYINNTHSGTSVINLVGNGSDLTDDVIGTILVSVVSESGSFTSGASYEGALVWYDYTLDHVDNGGEKDLSNGTTVTNTAGYNTDWYIDSFAEAGTPSTDPDPGTGGGSEPEPDPEPSTPDSGGHEQTTTVKTVIASNAINYSAFRRTDKLLRRMGELRHNGDDDEGAWLRVEGAKGGRKGSFEDKFIHYEVGYDWQTRDDDKEKRFEGISLSYIRGKDSFNNVRGHGKERDEEVAFYRTSEYEHGQYLDLIGRAGRYCNHFDVFDSNDNDINGKNKNIGFSASAEYGRKVLLGGGLYIEPQAQLTYGYLLHNDYRTNNQVYVRNTGTPSLIGRIGTNVGLEFGKEKKGIVYAKANWLHEFLGDYKIEMVSNAGNRQTARGNYRESWFEYGLGIAYQCSKAFYIYADVERTADSNFYRDWVWNAGLRWTF